MTAQKKGGLVSTLRAVFWSFFGVRRKSDYLNDAEQLKPVHVILAGVILGAAFVLTLVLIVRIVVANAS